MDEIENQATCCACGSDMTLVRPGKWQCDVCESRDFIRREQAKALRWVADRICSPVASLTRPLLEDYANQIERGEVEL